MILSNINCSWPQKWMAKWKLCIYESFILSSAYCYVMGRHFVIEKIYFYLEWCCVIMKIILEKSNTSIIETVQGVEVNCGCVCLVTESIREQTDGLKWCGARVECRSTILSWGNLPFPREQSVSISQLRLKCSDKER